MEQAEKYWISACSISYGNTSDYYLILRRKIFLFDNFRGHFLSGPALKSCGPLIEKHIHAVKAGTSLFACLFHQHGPSGIVDNV